jgi:uncharacterized protein YndB with AHSA1/START domain
MQGQASKCRFSRLKMRAAFCAAIPRMESHPCPLQFMPTPQESWRAGCQSVVLLTVMGMNSSAGIIEKKVLIQASPEVIFRALTDAKDIAHWFCDRVTSDPKVGGELKAYWRMGRSGQAQRGRAVYTKLTPNSQVELHWLDDGAGETQNAGRHIIRYTIRLKRETSEVTLRDEGPPLADEETNELLDQGWIGLLRDLKDHCEAKQRSSRHRPHAAQASSE